MLYLGNGVGICFTVKVNCGHKFGIQNTEDGGI